jgi:hypothetical protein
MSNQIPTDRDGSIRRVTHLPYFAGGAGDTGSGDVGEVINGSYRVGCRLRQALVPQENSARGKNQ